jgi:hypothetical protein
LIDQHCNNERIQAHFNGQDRHLNRLERVTRSGRVCSENFAALPGKFGVWIACGGSERTARLVCSDHLPHPAGRWECSLTTICDTHYTMTGRFAPARGDVLSLSSSITMVDGRTMPRFGIGAWDMRGAECRTALQHAFRAGYRHVVSLTFPLTPSGLG